VLVPNGSAVADARHAPVPEGRTSVDFLFAGSSYWPNVEGFATIATPSLGFLPPTRRIHVVGSAGSALLEHPAMSRCLAINRSRLTVHGFLEMDELVAMMAAARCVIVPVFVGEGSNLKSADALASGAPVIMTRRATHGYEDLLESDSSGVTVVEAARDFRSAMLDTLTTPPPDSVGAVRARQLGWPTRLQPLVEAIRSLERQ
jgi:glycosyltransferase involved in cell wall biosynthesis